MPDHKTQVASIIFFLCLMLSMGLMALIEQVAEQCTQINEGTGTALFLFVALLYPIGFATTLLFDLSTKWIVAAMLIPTTTLVTSQGWDVVNCKFDTHAATVRHLPLIDKKTRTGRWGGIHRVCFVPSWHPPQIRLGFPCEKTFFDEHQLGDMITLQTKPGFLGDEWIVRCE